MPTFRTIVCAALVGVVATATASSAAAPRFKKTKRVVTIEYSNTCSATLQSEAASGPGGGICPEYAFTPKAGETYASVSVADATGQPTGVWYQPEASGVNDVPIQFICGSAKNLRLAKRTTYTAQPTWGVGSTTCPTPATTGKITVTLTNYRQ